MLRVLSSQDGGGGWDPVYVHGFLPSRWSLMPLVPPTKPEFLSGAQCVKCINICRMCQTYAIQADLQTC